MEYDVNELLRRDPERERAKEEMTAPIAITEDGRPLYRSQSGGLVFIGQALPVGIMQDGQMVFADRKVYPWQRRLSELTDPKDLRAWAWQKVLSVIQEHPGDEDRADALIGFGLLMAETGKR